MFQNWMKKKVEHAFDQSEKQDETMTSTELPDMDYYFMTGEIPGSDEATTTSFNKRLKPFAEKRMRVSILTLHFDANAKERILSFQEKVDIEPTYTRILNLFEHYIIPESGSKRRYTEFILGEVTHSINQAVIPTDETTIRVTTYELPSSPIHYIDQYNEQQQLVKREEYNWEGALRRVQSFVPQTGALYMEELIKGDGDIYMEKIYSGDANKNPVRHINWFKKTGIQTFVKKTDITQQWISTIQSQNDRLKLFIADDRKQDRHLFKIDKPDTAYYAAFVHNAHYKEDLHQLDAEYEELFKHVRKQHVDAVFFRHNEHKEEVEKILGEQLYFYTISSDEEAAWSAPLQHMLENRVRKDELRNYMERTKFVLSDLSSKHHVLHLQLDVKGEMVNTDHVKIDFAGYDRVNGAEIISQTIDENNQVSFPIGHFQTKKNIECNHTKYVDFYIRFQTEEGHEVLQRLEVDGELLTSKPSTVDGWSYQTKQGNYSWKVK
ncbi:alpha-glucosyltransferase N-terminal domain-containing protein [Bacillus sp. NPDC093026]|uniref:alpha-glucosyltransferase N-terminal domain-containing protein n=1 Tax=Bacillus sp. NPDC093026 TaxID=3363948 RepID=UPI00382F5D69